MLVLVIELTSSVVFAEEIIFAGVCNLSLVLAYF
jgi:hypothetical protein